MLKITEAIARACDATEGGGGDREQPMSSDAGVRRLVDDFNRLYYDGPAGRRLYETTSWLGVPALKCPLDLWIYQEILYETRPDVVIETGVLYGGSTLYLASVLDLLGAGEVLGVDITLVHVHPRVSRHPRVRLLEGNSVDPAIVREVAARCRSRRPMVILDADHAKPHVLAELRAYGSLVAPGCYLVVEDTNINGHPVFPDYGPGPYEAVRQFLTESPGWTVDGSRERLLVTFNPSGYLRRDPP
jgi:cephalosporin hydroxylase